MLNNPDTAFALRPEHSTTMMALPWGCFNALCNIKHALVLHLWSDTPMGVQFRPQFTIHEHQHPPVWCTPLWAWVLPMGVFLALQPIEVAHSSSNKVVLARRLYWVPNRQHNMRTLQIWLHAIMKETKQHSWWQNWLDLLGKGGA